MDPFKDLLSQGFPTTPVTAEIQFDPHTAFVAAKAPASDLISFDDNVEHMKHPFSTVPKPTKFMHQVLPKTGETGFVVPHVARAKHK